jgi:hypothetical protein
MFYTWFRLCTLGGKRLLWGSGNTAEWSSCQRSGVSSPDMISSSSYTDPTNGWLARADWRAIGRIRWSLGSVEALGKSVGVELLRVDSLIGLCASEGVERDPHVLILPELFTGPETLTVLFVRMIACRMLKNARVLTLKARNQIKRWSKLFDD